MEKETNKNRREKEKMEEEEEKKQNPESVFRRSGRQFLAKKNHSEKFLKLTGNKHCPEE